MYLKTKSDCSLPRLIRKSATGPRVEEVDGARWTLAHFVDGARQVIKDMFLSCKPRRPERNVAAFNKLHTVPWTGLMVYVARTAKYINDIPDGGLGVDALTSAECVP